MDFNLVDWFKVFSYETWERLAFTRSTKKIRTHEVTITENLVFNFYRLSKQFDLPIQIFEATNEANHGNDIEFALETSQGYILLPTQAKLLKPNEKYGEISHKVGGNYQINLLEKYGRAVKGVPLYLLYNTLDTTFNDKVDLLKGKINFDLKLYGCTICRLDFIKRNFFKKGKWSIPSFWNLHPQFGFPIFQLIESIGKNIEESTLFGIEKKLDLSTIQFYSQDEITDENVWRNLAPRPRIGYIPSQDKDQILDMKSIDRSYSPQYRIVLSSDPDFNKFRASLVGFDEEIKVSDEEWEEIIKGFEQE